MSIRKAQEFYHSLTPQQKHFVDNKTINTTLSVKHWLAFLGKAGAYDEYGDKARTILNWRIGFFIAGLVVSVIIIMMSQLVYLIVLPILFAYMAYDANNARKQFVNRDINNYLRLFFIPFLEAIKKKAGEEAKLSASLDFRDPFDATPERSTVQVRGIQRKVEMFQPKLIIAGVTLSDNTRLETVLLDEIRKIKWNNINGKSRSRTKTVHRLFIQLTVDKSKYRLKGSSTPEGVEFSENETDYLFKIKHKEKELTEGILKPSVFFLALASLYHLIEAKGGTVAPVEGQSLRAAPLVPGNLAEMMVWNDLIFNEYDMDSVMRRGRPVSDDDDDSQNIFDS